MKISTHQPIFSPWPGFFYKALNSDILVILDDVQFPLGTTWMSRNRFKFEQGTLWLTVPVKKKGKGLQRIYDVEVSYDRDWRKKHLKSLELAYAFAPYWTDHRNFWETLLEEKKQKLVDINLGVIEYLLKCLGISTKIILSSSLNIESSGNERLIEICELHQAETYFAQYEARNYIREDLFKKAGIEVRYLRFYHPVYPQLWGDFIYNLSAWDIIFNCGPKSLEIIADNKKGQNYSFLA